MELENGARGLNLTLQVLDGILCHNGEILEKEYAPERTKIGINFWRIMKSAGRKRLQQKAAANDAGGCLVRICDIIAYIGRDIEDAITVKLIKREDIPGEVVRVLEIPIGILLTTLQKI